LPPPAPLQPKNDALRATRTHDHPSTQAKATGKTEDISEIDFGAALVTTAHQVASADPPQSKLEDSPAPKRGRGRPKNPDPHPGTIKRGRGRPVGWKKPTPPGGDHDPSTINIDSNFNIGSYKGDIDILDTLETKTDQTSNKPRIKDILNQKELYFLELYLSGNYTQEKAMIAAGYVGYNKTALHLTAKKIIDKYELGTGDHRKIMRALGWGEVRVLQSLIEAATEFKSETVRLHAREALAKCLGIQKEVLEGVEGITIMINNPIQPGQPAAVGQPAGAHQPGASPALSTTRPLQITK
jgi:hypothetical protein